MRRPSKPGKPIYSLSREKRKTPERVRSAHILKSIRAEDFKAFYSHQQTGYHTRRGIVEYDEAFHADLTKFTRQLLTRRKEASALDIGSGEGYLGTQLRKIRGPNVNRLEVHGVGLARPPREKIQGFKSYRVGDVNKKFDQWYSKKSFDLITCFGSGHDSTIVPLIAQRLRPGGCAYVEFFSEVAEEAEQLCKYLRKKGFSAKINRRTDTVLGGFQCYIRYLQIERETN